MWKKLTIIFGIVIVIIILFNNVLMPWYVRHSVLVKVPNVVGLKYEEAKKVLESAGLELKQGNIRYDESKPFGQVLEQTPAPDEMVKYGRRVYVVICGGEQLIEVPKLVGRSLRDAKFTLEQRNLQVGEVVKQFSNEFPEDVIIRQVQQPGSKVKKSTKIDLIVSNGPQIGDIIIPDLIGKKVDEAKKILAEKKLQLGKITYQPSDKPVGVIIDQYPLKDKSAKENTAIDVIVSKKKSIDVTKIEESLKNEGQEDIDQKRAKEKDKDEKSQEDVKQKDKDIHNQPIDKSKDDKDKHPTEKTPVKEPKKETDTKKKTETPKVPPTTKDKKNTN
jgi:beta-lactam-binding protein with PASTA domain